jgi:hypothetical protein
MAKAKKGKKKNKKANKKQAIDLTLRLNVELEQSRKQEPRKQRVKRITSRNRQNLREMRRGMLTQAQAQGGGGQSVFANPAFYGNVKMLTDSAMNQYQNQRYSLEQQVRESSAEQKAMLAAGRAEAAQQAAQALATQTQQLTNLQQRFGFQPQQLAAVAGQAGVQIGQQQERARSAEQQLEQAGIERQYAQEQQNAAAAIPKADLVPQLIPLLNQHYGEGHFTPQGITKHMLTKYEGDIRAAIAGDEQARTKLIAKFDDTKRGRQPRSEPEPQPQAADDPFELEVSDRPLGGFSGEVSSRTFEAETPQSLLRKRREIGAPQKGPVRNPVDYDSDTDGQTDEEDLLSPATRQALLEAEGGYNVSQNPLDEEGWDVSGISELQQSAQDDL